MAAQAPGRHQRRVFATTLTLVLAACGGAGTPESSADSPASGSASATSTPRATPQPVDIAAVFVDTITDPHLVARSEIEGSLRIGELEGTVAGLYDFGGGDSHAEQEITIGGSTQKTGQIEVGDDSYELSGGRWFVDTDADDGGGFTTWLTALEGLRDSGEATFAGRRLHRLTAPDLSVPADALGLQEPSIQDLEATAELWAEADGAPAAIAVTATWAQSSPSGETQPVEMSMVFTFTQVGGAIDIEPPDEVWARYSSEAIGIELAHPLTWVASEEGGVPTFVGPTQTLAIVWGRSVGEATLDQWVDEVVLALGGPPDSSEPVTVGGIPGTLLTYHPSPERDLLYQAVATMSGSGVVLIEYYDQPGNEEQSRADFDELLSAISFLR